MVELALLLPVLVFGLIGAADLARAFALQLAIENGARAGAEAYAIRFAATPAIAQARAMDEISRTPAIAVHDASLSVNTPARPTPPDGTQCFSTSTLATPYFYTVT